MAIDPAVRPGVRTPCPYCQAAILMRHCKQKGCTWAQCKRCGWTGTTVPPLRSNPPLPTETEGPFHE